MTAGNPLNIMDSNFLTIHPITALSKIVIERSGIITNIYNDPNITRTPVFNADGTIINYAYNYYIPQVTTGFILNIKIVGSTNIYNLKIQTPSQTYFDLSYIISLAVNSNLLVHP